MASLADVEPKLIRDLEERTSGFRPPLYRLLIFNSTCLAQLTREQIVSWLKLAH
jgi:hypothetical protein